MVLSSFLGGAAGGAGIQIVISAIDKFSKEFKSAQKETKKTGQGFNAMGAALKKLAIPALAGVATALGAFAISSIKAKIAMEPIKRGFQDLAKDSDNFLTELNEATEGTVSNFELMKSANNALLLGIDQEALPKMFKAAAVVGQAAGRTTTEALNDISIGIGRQSRLILDNLGIIVDSGAAYERFADKLGKTAKGLSETEKKAAFTEAAMQGLQLRAIALGDEMEKTTSFQIAVMNREIELLKEQVGEAFGASASATVGAFTGIIQGLREQVEILNEEQRKAAEMEGGFLEKAFGASSSWDEFLSNFLGTNEELKNMNENVADGTDEFINFQSAQQATAQSLQDLNEGLIKSQQELQGLQDELKSTDEEMNKLLSQRFAGETASDQAILVKERELKLLQRERLDLERNGAAFEENAEKIQIVRDAIERLRLDSQINFDLQRQEMVLTKQASDDASQGVVEDIAIWKQDIVNLITEQENLRVEIQNLSDKIVVTKTERDKLQEEFFKIKSSADEAKKSMENLKTAIDNLKSKTITVTTIQRTVTGNSDDGDDGNGKQFGGLVGLNGPERVLVGEAGPEFVKPLNKPMSAGNFGGGGGINITIGTLQGLDADDVAEALQDKLQTLITTA